jgi:hypothetical protein
LWRKPQRILEAKNPIAVILSDFLKGKDRLVGIHPPNQRGHDSMIAVKNVISVGIEQNQPIGV